MGAVVVAGGGYRGYFELSAAITLVGEGRPELDGGGTGSVLTVPASFDEDARERTELWRLGGVKLDRNGAAQKIVQVGKVFVRTGVPP